MSGVGPHGHCSARSVRLFSKDTWLQSSAAKFCVLWDSKQQLQTERKRISGKPETVCNLSNEVLWRSLDSTEKPVNIAGQLS